jgi:hypothetical protein
MRLFRNIVGTILFFVGGIICVVLRMLAISIWIELLMFVTVSVLFWITRKLPEICDLEAVDSCRDGGFRDF